MARNERIRTWTREGFTLHVYDTDRCDQHGKAILAYELYDQEMGDEPLFTGADFHCSPLHAIDSDETLATLLGFLSLRPGDTDSEYFEHYSQRQRDWCEQRAEDLSWIVWELEQAYKPLDNYTITHEPWEQAWKAGRLNRALELRIKEEEEERRYTLAAGYSDTISAYTQDETIYVITTNSRHGYVGLEAWQDNEKTEDLFFQNADEELGSDVWDLGDRELLERLEQYLG
jgi:hypothetical protein